MTREEATQLLTEWAGAVRTYALDGGPDSALRCSQLRKKVDAVLLAALDDAERIEWLEARQWIDMQRDIDGVWLEADDVKPERWIPSVREAIDAARAGGEG